MDARLPAATVALVGLFAVPYAFTPPGSSIPESAGPLDPVLTLDTDVGQVAIAVREQMVPLTAAHVIGLADAGFYDGLQFDRIVPGIDVQAGDPSAAGRPAASSVRDEFHPALRHDRPGVVSLATAGPDGGTSSFFITTAAAPSFDDVYPVFGQVVAGMDVVRAIAAQATSSTAAGPPLHTIHIRHATVSRPAPVDPAWIRRDAAIAALESTKTVAAGGSATFAVVARNLGNVVDTLTLAATAPEGWSAAFDVRSASVAAGSGFVALLTVTPAPADAGGTVLVTLPDSPGAATGLDLHVRVGSLGPPPAPGSAVELEYSAVFPDGRLFATTQPSLAAPLARATAVPLPAAGALPYTTPASGGDAFDRQVLATHLGESRVARLAAGGAFEDAGPAVRGRASILETRLVSVTVPA